MNQGENYPQPMAAQNLSSEVRVGPVYMTDTQAPMPTRSNIARPISIRQLNHGYVIEVGCQSFAIESKEALLHRLGGYLSDPSKVEEDWQSGKLKF